MKLGAVIQPPTLPAPAGASVERARELEDAGFDSLWVVHVAGRGFMLPDPLLMLAAAAAATRRVPLGTAILQVPLYEPGALAFQIFSLMHLAGDRLRLGVGAGSTEGEFRLHGRSYDRRFAIFRENLAELRGVLASGRAGMVDLTPYPTLLGGPPLLYGTWGREVATAARDFDGWIASAMYRSTEQVIERLGAYRDAGGRQAIVSSLVIGRTAKEVAAARTRLDAFAEAGFDEAVVMLGPGSPAPETVRGWVP